MHEQCVLDALAGVQADRVLVAEVLEALESMVRAGVCPRCEQLVGRCPATSRSTPDRCVLICEDCGADEAYGDGPPALAWWPMYWAVA
jgi:hypothetical protein